MTEAEQAVNVMGIQTASTNLSNTFNGLKEAEELNCPARELFLILKYVEIAFLKSAKKDLKLF